MRAVPRVISLAVLAVGAACGSFGADPQTATDAGTSTMPDASATDAGSDVVDISPIEEPCDVAFCASFDQGAAPWGWPEATANFPFATATGASPPNALVVSAKAADAPHFLSWHRESPVTFVSVQAKLSVRNLPSLPSSDAVLLKIACTGTTEFGVLKLKQSGALQIQGQGSADDHTEAKVDLESWFDVDLRWDFQQRNLSLLGSAADLNDSPLSVMLDVATCPTLTVSLGMVDFHDTHADEYRVLFDDVRIQVQ